MGLLYANSAPRSIWPLQCRALASVREIISNAKSWCSDTLVHRLKRGSANVNVNVSGCGTAEGKLILFLTLEFTVGFVQTVLGCLVYTLLLCLNLTLKKFAISKAFETLCCSRNSNQHSAINSSQPYTDWSYSLNRRSFWCTSRDFCCQNPVSAQESDSTADTSMFQTPERWVQMSILQATPLKMGKACHMMHGARFQCCTLKWPANCRGG